MDETLRKLEAEYQLGNERAGLSLLRQMVRIGLLREEDVFLAAAYRFPLAVEYVGRTPTEEEALPLGDSQKTTWNPKLYVQRGLAAAMCATQAVLPHIDKFTEVLPDEITADLLVCAEAREMVVDWLENDIADENERHMRVFRLEGMLSLMIPRSSTYSVDVLEIHSLMMATSAVVWTIGQVVNDPTTVPGGATLATTQACMAMAYLDQRLQNRPLYPEVHESFGKDVIEKVYTAICQSMVPIILKPFPVQ